VHRLENSRWGFESSCFVCEDRNPAGLRIPFFHDPDAGEVVATVELDERFSGAPTYIHGGVVLAVLDEAMAWATIAEAGCFAVTKDTTTSFSRPVRVGATHEVRARVVDEEPELRCEAVLRDADGRRCATAAATFVPLGPAQALDAIGTELTDDDATYLRGQDR
jgi:uncharacterized protein (TIGR00369 family)